MTSPILRGPIRQKRQNLDTTALSVRKQHPRKPIQNHRYANLWAERPKEMVIGRHIKGNKNGKQLNFSFSKIWWTSKYSLLAIGNDCVARSYRFSVPLTCTRAIIRQKVYWTLCTGAVWGRAKRENTPFLLPSCQAREREKEVFTDSNLNSLRHHHQRSQALATAQHAITEERKWRPKVHQARQDDHFSSCFLSLLLTAVHMALSCWGCHTKAPKPTSVYSEFRSALRPVKQCLASPTVWVNGEQVPHNSCLLTWTMCESRPAAVRSRFTRSVMPTRASPSAVARKPHALALGPVESIRVRSQNTGLGSVSRPSEHKRCCTLSAQLAHLSQRDAGRWNTLR